MTNRSSAIPWGAFARRVDSLCLLPMLVGMCGNVFAATEPSATSGPWRLFIDDRWVLETRNTTRTLHQPIKNRLNPVIKADVPWESNPYLFGTMIYDHEASLFKAWYMTYNVDLPPDLQTSVLYAESHDAIRWERPTIGLFEFEDSRRNNIVLTSYGHHALYSPSVIKDPNAKDPQRLYKMAYWDFPLGPQGYQDDGMCVAFSPDGIHWTRHPGNPVLHARKQARSISDVINVMYDTRRRVYVAFTKGWAEPWPRFRQVVRTESPDFVNWSEPEVVLTHAFDEKDPQSYGMFVTEYEDLYLGLLASYKKPGDETIDFQLTVSHDNQTWNRVCGQATFLPLGAQGSWDDGMLCSSPLLLHGDTVYILYSGWNGPHNTKDRRAAIGLATLPKDRFVSVDAIPGKTGTVRTLLLRGASGPLRLNAEVHRPGRLQVELRSPDGRVLPGFDRERSRLKRDSATTFRVSWGEKSNMPEGSEPVEIVFLLEDASIYAFNAGALRIVGERRAR